MRKIIKELTDNSLNNELDEIHSLLSSKTKEQSAGDWEKRQNCLKKLAEYVTILGCDSISLVKAIDRLAPCFIVQFMDLRSSITKQIHILINLCAKTLEMDFNTAAEKIITTEGLLKLINNEF